MSTYAPIELDIEKSEAEKALKLNVFISLRILLRRSATNFFDRD